MLRATRRSSRWTTIDLLDGVEDLKVLTAWEQLVYVDLMFGGPVFGGSGISAAVLRRDDVPRIVDEHG